jgi:Tfp pilus assembly protein PilV
VAHLHSPSRSTLGRRLWAEDVGIILVSTLTKVLLVLAVLGVAGYDAIAISINAVSLKDEAQAAAQAGHQVLRNGDDAKAAYTAVMTYAKEHGLTVVPQSFAVSSHHTVTVEVRRDARVIAARYLPRISSYVVATASASASDEII